MAHNMNEDWKNYKWKNIADQKNIYMYNYETDQVKIAWFNFTREKMIKCKYILYRNHELETEVSRYREEKRRVDADLKQLQSRSDKLKV